MMFTLLDDPTRVAPACTIVTRSAYVRTPPEAFTVIDVARNALGMGPCEYVLDLENQKQQYNKDSVHLRPRVRRQTVNVPPSPRTDSNFVGLINPGAAMQILSKSRSNSKIPCWLLPLFGPAVLM